MSLQLRDDERGGAPTGAPRRILSLLESRGGDEARDPSLIFEEEDDGHAYPSSEDEEMSDEAKAAAIAVLVSEDDEYDFFSEEGSGIILAGGEEDGVVLAVVFSRPRHLDQCLCGCGHAERRHLREDDSGDDDTVNGLERYYERLTA